MIFVEYPNFNLKLTLKVNGEDEAQIDLQSGEWDSILAFDSLSHSFDQSYKLMKKTNDWTRPSDLISVLPQIGKLLEYILSYSNN